MKNLLKLIPFIFVVMLFFVSCENNIAPSPTYYTVTFDSNGGTTVASQTVENGKTATKPQAPTKAATEKFTYTFEGWYNGSTVFDFTMPITANITLKAKWTEEQQSDDSTVHSNTENSHSGDSEQNENAENIITDENNHQHSFSELWSYDENYHWHAATCVHTEQISDKELHSWNEGEITKLPTLTEKGYRKYTCSICNATKSVAYSYEESDLYLENDTLCVNSIPKINGYFVSINNYIPASGKVYITSKCSEISMIGCTNMKSLGISGEVKNISNTAFSGCSNLESVKLEIGLQKIGKNAFLNCSSLRTIIIPNTVSEIGKWAFWGCEKLESITLPKSLAKIDDNTFRNCTSLTEIEIPNSVTSVGTAAFAGCANLKKVIMYDNVKEIESAAFPDNITELEIGDSIQYDRSSIGMMSGLTKVKITLTNATVIGKNSFWGCNNLTDVQILKNHNEKIIIDDDAFCGCVSLKEFPFDIVGEIKSSSFLRCGFETLHLTAKTVGKNAFAGCKNLRTIHLNQGVENLGEGAFYNISHAADGIKTINVYISNTVKSIEQYNFFNCCNTYLKFENSGNWHTTVILPDSIYEYDNAVEANTVYEVPNNYGTNQYKELTMFAVGDTILIEN
ncbi:MAG: leucine-rich repeat protein [Treponema sp.]|nr:leucine-rich repeat protein [Treponema sp.]